MSRNSSKVEDIYDEINAKHYTGFISKEELKNWQKEVQDSKQIRIYTQNGRYKEVVDIS